MKSLAAPKYRQILDRLSRDIAAGRYRPGQKLPSEAALVQRFGASRITVGRAVRELQLSGLVDRVAGSGTFVRNAAATQRTGLLFGLVVPNLSDTEIFEPVCQAIAASAGEAGHALLWAQADSHDHPKLQSNSAGQALQLCHQCIAHEVAGVFFAPLEMTEHSSEINRRVMKLLKDASIPVVLLDRRADDPAARDRSDLVGIDNQRAGFLAASHLVKLGARRIGFLAYENQATTVRARIAGYTAALAECASGARPHVFHLENGPHLPLPAAALECDAFVCANDRLAGRLMHSLIARKIAVPQDVRIVGIDDVNYASLLPVPLTTVHQPCRDIGETALRVMLERLDRPKMPARDVLLDCELVVRESCGASLAQRDKTDKR